MVAEGRGEKKMDKFDGFGEVIKDGRLTTPSDEKVYRLRDATLLSKKLGRSLTEEEMKRFEMKQ